MLEEPTKLNSSKELKQSPEMTQLFNFLLQLCKLMKSSSVKNLKKFKEYEKPKHEFKIVMQVWGSYVVVVSEVCVFLEILNCPQVLLR